MDKSSLRKQMIKARLDLDSVNYTTKSNFIISKLKQHPDFIKAKTIGIYVSFRNEVNTISLIKEMLSNKNICVPKIEDKEMNPKVLVIAEAGVNHNGSLALAIRLVDEAAAAGADMIKFQTFQADKLVSKTARQAEYQRRNMGTSADDSQYAMLKRLELSREQHEELVAHCRTRGIRFFSTAFDLDSMDYLHSLGLGLWKIPSGEITNYPYLKKIAGYGEPIILSTGMCELSDVEAALQVLLSNGVRKEQVTVLHCNTEYPTPMKDVNLRAMLEIGRTFGVKVGYSDHTEGIEIPIAAVALGATVIEKHFTLDKSMDVYTN